MEDLKEELSPAKGRIFRITHLQNIPWILRNGLHCASSTKKDPGFVTIGDPSIIARRNDTVRQNGLFLSDFVPFYFTPFSPMLLNILTGARGVTKVAPEDIVFLFSTVYFLEEQGHEFYITDRHALLQTARFSKKTEDLNRIDWALLQARDFRRNDLDPGKLERYQAEALIRGPAKIELIRGLACCGDNQKEQVQSMVKSAKKNIPVFKKPSWYFR